MSVTLNLRLRLEMIKTIEEHYQDWYNEKIGGDINLSLEFIDKDAVDFAKYCIKQISLSDVVEQGEQLFCPRCQSSIIVIDKRHNSVMCGVCKHQWKN